MMEAFESLSDVKFVRVATPISISSSGLQLTTGGPTSSQHLQITHLNGNNASLIQNSNILDLGKKLLDACKAGETDEVRSLMESGAPFTTDWLGTSPLHFAAQYGHYETAEVLLRAGVSRDTRTKVDRTPLHFAAQEGHLSLVDLLIGQGAEVNAKDLLKMTPLHWAVEKGHYEVIERLLISGADVNLQNKFDLSPIDIAVQKGRIELLPLLQKYINVSIPKTEQSSPTSSVKSRPTILPNKANRTQKPPKPVTGLSSSLNLSEPIILSSAKGKTINLESLKKIISNATTTSNGTTATIKANSASDALQWLELNGITTTTSTALASGVTISKELKNKKDFGDSLDHTLSNGLTISSRLATSGNSTNSVSFGNASTTTTANGNKIITIVSNNQLPQLIKGAQSPIVFVSKTESDKEGKKTIKFEKITPGAGGLSAGVTKPTITAITAAKGFTSIRPVGSFSTNNEELEKLRQELKNTKDQLQATQKELEETKHKLTEKDQQLQSYRMQFGDMQPEIHTEIENEITTEIETEIPVTQIKIEQIEEDEQM